MYRKGDNEMAHSSTMFYHFG